MSAKVDHWARVDALERLEGVLSELDNLVRRCAGQPEITSEDEEQYAELVKEARSAYGAVAEFLPQPAVTAFGQRYDVFQHILGMPQLSTIFIAIGNRMIWQGCCGAATSVVQQAIGKARGEAGRKGALDPEAVARWRWLILGVEGLRRLAIWPFLRLRCLLRLGIERIERSLVFRLMAIAAVVGTCTVLVVAALALAGVL